MSDPHQAPSSVSFFLESLFADDDFPRDLQCNEQFSTLHNMSDLKGPWWQGCDFVSMDNAGTQSDSEVTGAKVEGSWIPDMGQPPARKKRCRQSVCHDGEVVSASQLKSRAPVMQTRERQRGKNWEKAEEDILVDRKSEEKDWKFISECLQEHGYIRNHKHCADKWYALRKHYLEIHQWMLDNPAKDYWDRSDGERIRSVPPSFCQKWYLIFDAAEKKEGRRKVPPKEDPRPSHSLAAAVTSSRSDPGSLGAQPSCSLSIPRDEGFQPPADWLCSGDATYKIESCLDDGLFFSNGAYPNQPNFNIQVLVTEINNLSQALHLKFKAEEEERSRHLAIKEKKLELKKQRFEYKRKRDEEKQQSVPPCLNFSMKTYEC